MQPAILNPTAASPYRLEDDRAYRRWRERKLSKLNTDPASLTVDIVNPFALSASERTAMLRCITDCNMVIYRLSESSCTDSRLVLELGNQLGLHTLDDNFRADEDRVTRLEDRPQSGNQYIPYTNKPLSWHTDGYYNRPDRQVRSVILHCVSPAAVGGENAWMDHEILYLRLRDEDPALIHALMHPQAMTIPPNIEAGVELRPTQSGPVFSVDAATGRLHMRYSARTRNIQWRDDGDTRRASAMISELLDDELQLMRYRLQAGEGIVGNNVLHNRTAFEDSAAQQRLMYRARYYEAIS